LGILVKEMLFGICDESKLSLKMKLCVRKMFEIKPSADMKGKKWNSNFCTLHKDVAILTDSFIN